VAFLRMSGLLLLLVVLQIPSCMSVAASPKPPSILSIVFPPTTPYDQPLNIETTVAYDVTAIPSVTVYYTYANSSSSGWRIAMAGLNSSYPVFSSSSGLGIFTATIPNPVYHEQMVYNSTIVFYVEVRDPFGNIVLTAREATRWDPTLLRDKFVVLVTDPYPPALVNFHWTPSSPSAGEEIVFTAQLIDYGSGVSSVQIMYSVDGSTSKTLAMDEVQKGDYSAVLPALREGAHLTFHLLAVDRAGNELTGQTFSYEVGPPPILLPTRQLLTYIAIIISGLTIAAIWLVARRRTRGPKEISMKHPKAMTALFALTGLFALYVYYQLLANGAPLLGLIVASVAVLAWGIIDPRVNILVPYKTLFGDYPPTALVAEGYIILVTGATPLGLGYLLHIYALSTAYRLFFPIAQSAVILAVLGILLQIAWPWLKEMDFGIVVERAEEHADGQGIAT